jgi:PAS domain S-box-containing protein
MAAASPDWLMPQEPESAAACPLPLDEAQLTAFFGAISEAVYIEELGSHRIVYWSPNAAKMFGYDRAQILKQSVARLLADPNEFASECQAVDLESGGCWRGRRRFRRATGEVFDGTVNATIWRSAAGGCVINVVQPARAPDAFDPPRFEAWANPQMFQILDQSEQLQKGTERKQGEQMIGRLLRNVVNCALFTTDSNGYIMDWNRVASALLGYDRADVCGQHLSVIDHGGEGRTLGDALHQASERGTARSSQWLTRKDSKRVYVNVAVFGLSGEAQPQGFLFLLRDNSGDRSLRRKLREREQMAAIGTAASVLAHEIGNPLNGISATVQLLEHFVSRENLPTAHLMLSSINDLKSEIQRLTVLLNEFKNIAWPQKLALAPVDLRSLIQGLIGLIEKRASRQNIEVTVEFQEGMPLLDGDEDKLKEALLHVLDNAVEAMPAGGRLQIKAYPSNDAICIDISDTGVGIPENFKVFDLFSSTKPHGTGFGLFIVQQIILAHDGTITYSSTPGQGTTFHITFVVHQAPESLVDEFSEPL